VTAPTPIGADPAPRNRIDVAESKPLGPDSLVGSFFHGFGGRFHAHQGCVVAEPSPGVYLVELFSFGGTGSTYQRIAPVAEMSEWRFYDSEKWMSHAYDYGGVAEQWQQDRAAEQRPNVEGDCPVCGRDSLLIASEDSYFHLDGADNGACWRAFGRGEAQ